jgi:hypothetical protein
MKSVNFASGLKILGFFLIFVLFLSSIRLGYSVTNSEPCNQTQVMEFSASGSDPNFPAAAVGDLNDQTIWSTYGKGSWIQLDLGTQKTLCSVDVQWYKGDQRQNNFVISVSKDGSSFKDIVDSTSKGSTSSFDSYDLQDLEARYMKLTINGNSQNNYASIAEVRVNSIDLENINAVEQPNGNSISNDCSKQTQVSGATAFGHYRNYIPSNAIDKNPKSRWVNQNNPSSITLDLGNSKTVCGLDIQWFKGEFRVYNFIVSVSKDNKNYEVILKTKSKGSTSGSESYTTPEANAKYVRITVNGNNENNFASISEINVKTSGSHASFDTPAQSELDRGVNQEMSEEPHDGMDTGVNQEISEEPHDGMDTGVNQEMSKKPRVGTDGVQMIYPTASGGETWFFNPNNPEDGQFDENGANIEKNADGSWHVPPGTTRMDVFTKGAGLLSDQQRSNFATYDYSELDRVGYWLQPSDWKNIEVTGYFKVTSTSSGDGISFVSRSVRHSNSIQDGCGGSSYHNNIRFEGTFQFKKEMWHVNYDILPPSEDGIGSIMNKWVGFKGVVYNLPDGSVKLESYVDKDNNNQWQKVRELVDTGDWGDDMTHCNAKTQGAAITWGSPMFIFKSTGVTYDFKNLSIREIALPQ